MAEPKGKLVLKPGVICGYMENLNFSADRESMQLSQVNCSGQELEQLAKCAEEIKDVTEIDFSNNGLGDVTALKDIPRLITLNLSNNRIKNMAVFATEEAFMNLKWLDISNNKFNEWPGFKCPKLDYLNISGNKLEKVNEGWTGHPTLRTLCAVDNKFKNLNNFKALPNLEELYLQANLIVQFNGWEGGLPKLKRLNLRRNKIANIDDELPELPELEWLNLRHNAIENLQVCFKVFTFAPKIVDINIINNPCDQSCTSFNLLMAEFLVKKPSLTRFCKTRVTERHQLEAVHLGHYKWDV